MEDLHLAIVEGLDKRRGLAGYGLRVDGSISISLHVFANALVRLMFLMTMLAM